MNLLEKARLIKDIQHTIHAIKNRELPLIEQAKATHHLKEILNNCKKSVIQPSSFQHNESDFQNNIVECLKTSDFKKTYRGVFQEQSNLFNALNENPYQGWAIFYQKESPSWQIWLIPQAKKGAIYCSFKTNLSEAYEWLLQQQKLLGCFTPDRDFITVESQTLKSDVEDQIKFAHILQNQKSHACSILNIFDQESILTQITTNPALYNITFMENVSDQRYVEWFSQTKDIEKIKKYPFIVAEKLDINHHFLNYMIVLGIQNYSKISTIFNQYAQNFNFKINSVKILNSETVRTNLHSLENFFECYAHADTIIPSAKNIGFMPKNLISTQKLVQFEEAMPTIQTPVLLLKDKNHYRIIHGINRLNFAEDEIALPYHLFTREDGITWQKVQDTAKKLPSPVKSELLYQALKQPDLVTSLSAHE